MILIFQNIRKVIKADNLLSEKKIKHRIIPVPKEYSSECGMCIEIEPVDCESVKALLLKQNISVTVINN